MFDKRLMKICPESKKYIVGNILLQWFDLFLNSTMTILIAQMIQGLYEKSMVMREFWTIFFVIGAIIIVRFGTTRAATRMSYLASRTVKQKLRELIYTKLLRLGNKYKEQVSTAELVQESVEGVNQLESYFGQYVPQFFYAFLAPITLFFLFGFAGSFKAAAILLVCVPLIPGAIMMVQKIAKKLLAKYWGQYTQLGSTFLENLQGMTTLKIYQADEYKNQEMNKESEHFRVVTMKVLTMQLNSIIIMDFFAYGGAGLGILLAAKDFINGKITLAACIFMILLSVEFFLPMRRLGSYFHVAMNGMAASDKIFQFLSLKEREENVAIFSPDRKQEKTDKDTDIFKESGIRLSQVSFSYDKEREVLHNVSLAIPENSFVGIVGESGSGKSTVASLIMGRNTVDEGQIQIGKTDLSLIPEETLMRNITYVGHNSFFFKGTVKENLLVAKKNATDEELWQVLEICKLSEFLRSGQGLETPLLENAVNLSGGQRQRLALSRAILHDSKIYIFDEATSNIDVESEQILLDTIHEMTENHTVLFITHRLANVAEADKIYVMQDGKVTESGKHKDLLAASGEYSKLWETQRKLENFC